MTNGEKLKEIFQDVKIITQYDIGDSFIVFTLNNVDMQVNIDWWNAEYKEPTTKNDLGVDSVSRQAVLELIADDDLSMGQVVKGIHALPSVTPQEPRCKECKWWKDSDGEYRRGCGAESKCPINRREVFEGNGYCYLFELQESEVEE